MNATQKSHLNTKFINIKTPGKVYEVRQFLGSVTGNEIIKWLNKPGVTLQESKEDGFYIQIPLNNGQTIKLHLLRWIVKDEVGNYSVYNSNYFYKNFKPLE